MAVAGTLLGSVITHVFQRLASQRGEDFARAEALRQERVAVYSAFAAAVEDYRRGQADRWYRGKEDPDGPAYVTARDEAHRLRTVARQELYRVKLVTDQRDVRLAAEKAYDRTRDVSKATDQAGHDTRDAASKNGIDSFVTDAAPLVR
ncbi:hypothetical protein [Streptomyces reniochalinae]|uniref:hypothetical protein n=1 Tax=Streptomyces reniochalinae TaxID=2250578 RepID=UPI0015F0F617|nr:hypothetical protein [Streptomyces reniochalinae]